MEVALVICTAMVCATFLIMEGLSTIRQASKAKHELELARILDGIVKSGGGDGEVPR